LVKLPGELLVPPFSAFTSGSIRSISLCNTSNARNASLVAGTDDAPCGNPAADVVVVVAAGAVLKSEDPVGIAAFTPRFLAKFVPRLVAKFPGAAGTPAEVEADPLSAKLTKSKLSLKSESTGKVCCRLFCSSLKESDKASKVALVATTPDVATGVARAGELGTNTGEGVRAGLSGIRAT